MTTATTECVYKSASMDAYSRLIKLAWRTETQAEEERERENLRSALSDGHVHEDECRVSYRFAASVRRRRCNSRSELCAKIGWLCAVRLCDAARHVDRRTVNT